MKLSACLSPDGIGVIGLVGDEHSPHVSRLTIDAELEAHVEFDIGHCVLGGQVGLES